jgi:hypothetical protein
MKLHRWYAGQHRPTHITHLGMSWTLLRLGRWSLQLTLRYRSAPDFEGQHFGDKWAMVIEGCCVFHRQITPEGRPARNVWAPEVYVYTSAGRAYVATALEPFKTYSARDGEIGGLELFPARKMEDRIVDFPKWMAGDEILTETEKQVWLIQLCRRRST